MHRFAALALITIMILLNQAAFAAELYVSPHGNDAAPGTRSQPLHTFAAAQRAARRLRLTHPGAIRVNFMGGVYYLPATVVFTPEDSGTALAPITYAAMPGEPVVLSGGERLKLNWRPYRDGIYQADVPADLATDQLFINGERQILARYPNYDPGAQYYNGTAADAISKERAARWSDPTGGFIHAMHVALWGDLHYRITGKDRDGNLTYEGGWQNNRQMGMHPEYRYVENIFEELDAPGEWFLDTKQHKLYYYPPQGLDLAYATVEAVRLRHLIEFRGTQQHPISHITLQGFVFRHAARTFMDNREPLLRSDWTVYRGGALFFTGCEDCLLEECILDQVGGNGVFVSGYNRRITVRRCHIARAGANGVAFVGDPKAVRSPLFEYNQRQDYAHMDKTPGPLSDDYPADCLVDDCLIHETGRVEKQTAPVQIEMAQSITVRHCSLYDVPRAGINIGDGSWGGNIVEYCDIFDTVRETGDHGSFNSWGRDRYWGLKDVDLNRITTSGLRDLPLLDMVKPNILRNNRWRCDHGWDIDLDDGSSNYHIYNNLCLNGGLKNREGFYRVVENNVMVNNSFHPHVWYTDSEDIFRRNIVFTRYQPIQVGKPWGQEVDNNLLHRPGQTTAEPAIVLHDQSGRDLHSLEADALFIDPAHGDYRVKPGSPALALGFRNFPMDRFGVQWPPLKALARTPRLPGAADESAHGPAPRPADETQWQGATIKNVSGPGEVSASGLPGEIGVLLADVPAESHAAKAGLKRGDVILKVSEQPANSVHDLLTLTTAAKGKSAALTIWRDQQAILLTVTIR